MDLRKAVRVCDDGVMINIDVSPNSNTTALTGFNVWRRSFVVKVRSPPRDGKANVELVKYFEGIFKAEVKIVRGEWSNQKVVLIRGIDVNDAIDKIRDVLQKKRKFKN
jgi:uncharacterized protein (TIGR00251 family)